MYNFKQFNVKKQNENYWKVSFNNPPVNTFDDNSLVEFEKLVEIFQKEKNLKVVVFESDNKDFFIAHYSQAAGVKKAVTPYTDGLLPWSHKT